MDTHSSLQLISHTHPLSQPQQPQSTFRRLHMLQTKLGLTLPPLAGLNPKAAR